MQKNTASQKFVVFAFNRTNNVPLAGDAANITANLQKDFGTSTATNDTNPTELEDGYYAFDATQAETDADSLVIYPVSSTSDIQVIGVPGQMFTVSAGSPDEIVQSGNNFTRIGAGGINLTALQGNLGQGIAQGGTASTIQLASGETFATNELRGCVVNITLGTGKGQSRWISANIGVTDTCTIVPDWITTPDATTIYEIVQGATSMQAIRNAPLIEGAFDRIANNWSNFFNNDNTQSPKRLDDVGGQALPGGRWTWSTATSGVPNPGRIRGNNATIASITELSIHQETVDLDNLGVLISALRSGDRIGIFFAVNPDVFLIFDVTATPILTGSVYAVTGTVDSTAGSFVNSSINVGFVITGNAAASVANRIEMDSNSVDLNTLIAGVAAIPTTAMRGTDNAATSAKQDTMETTLNAIPTTAMRGTDNANTVVPDAAGVVPTLAEILESQLTEAYAADGVAPTLTQAIFLIQQALTEFAIVSTLNTVKKIDGSTTAAVMTLDDATDPTSSTRTS